MSNAWVTCLQAGDNPAKAGLIPNVVIGGIAGGLKVGIRKDLSLGEGPASYQLVGEVTAHQGYDG